MSNFETSRVHEVLESICARHNINPEHIPLDNTIPLELKKLLTAQFAVMIFSIGRRISPKAFQQLVSTFRDTLLVLVGPDFLSSDDFLSYHDLCFLDAYPEINPETLRELTAKIKIARDSRG